MIICYHRYQIEYIDNHEIVCPRYTLKGGTEVIVIPWFLIPGRPYPIQIYLYACNLYSTSPSLGQRGVAEATRKKFKLKAFSHSTVSRSFRSFEQCRELSLENKIGKEFKDSTSETPKLIGPAAKADAKKDKRPHSEGRFPSVIDTLARRKEMRGFFPKLTSTAKIADIESTSGQFVESRHKKTGRMIL